MPLSRHYYKLKPLLPRWLQIMVRRRIVRWKRAGTSGRWPIDPGSGRAPQGWLGWPEEKRFALVLTHDVDTLRGQERVERLADLEQGMGFRSSFNFVPERYPVSAELRGRLRARGFEVGVHDLNHDGCLYASKEVFVERARRINEYLREWQARGFRSACMYHNLEWIGLLDIDYDASTFDTDPFEPQPDGVGTIFPFRVDRPEGRPFVELPYTLAQDFTVFILLGEKTIDLWKRKLDWIAGRGGMALVNVHPDYIAQDGGRIGLEEYPLELYRQFLEYCRSAHGGEFWNALPSEVARFVLEESPRTRPAVR